MGSTSTNPATPPPPPYTSNDAVESNDSNITGKAKGEAFLSGVFESDQQQIAPWVDGELERILEWTKAEKERIARARDAWGNDESAAALRRLEQHTTAAFQRVKDERQASLDRARTTA